jgi:hypothetical protein
MQRFAWELFMSDLKAVEQFLADPTGFDVVLNDGSTATIAAYEGHGSGRRYRLRGSRSWQPSTAFHSILVHSVRVRS